MCIPPLHSDHGPQTTVSSGLQAKNTERNRYSLSHNRLGCQVSWHQPKSLGRRGSSFLQAGEQISWTLHEKKVKFYFQVLSIFKALQNYLLCTPNWTQAAVPKYFYVFCACSLSGHS